MTTGSIAQREESGTAVLSWSRKLVDGALRASVDRLPSALRRIAGYHFGWWDAQGCAAAGDAGKAVRPALVLLSAEAMGSPAVAALAPAVAVELVHNFSLLHDDVMDGDQLRRHRPTAWATFGVPPAILAGDAMASLASEILTDLDAGWVPTAVRWLNESVIELCDGQFADVAFEQCVDVDLAECLRMVEGKTAALLGVSCALGALVAGAEADRVELLRRFGRHLGMAFQLVDDLLGIWGDPAVTGKPAGADLSRRKKSLPVVAALASSTDDGAELADIYAADGAVDVARACALVELAGGREWARARAEEEMTAAAACLDAAHCVPDVRNRLIDVANLIVKRNH